MLRDLNHIKGGWLDYVLPGLLLLLLLGLQFLLYTEGNSRWDDPVAGHVMKEV